MWWASSAGVRTSLSSTKSTPSACRIWASTKWPMRALAITGIDTAASMPSIISGSLIRATPPSRRMSAGTRSSAITAQAPASSAMRACSGVTTSMMTPPLSISARPRLTGNVPVARVVCMITHANERPSRGSRCCGAPGGASERCRLAFAWQLDERAARASARSARRASTGRTGSRRSARDQVPLDHVAAGEHVGLAVADALGLGAAGDPGGVGHLQDDDVVRR